MPERAGGVSRVRDVVRMEQARQTAVAEEQPRGEPGSRGRPIGERH
jgi:hypothetical protein